MNDTLVQTYVQHEGRWYFVSTINRDCSAQLASGLVYSETLVWSFRDGKKKKLLYQDEGPRNNIETHQRAVSQIFYGGVNTLGEEES